MEQDSSITSKKIIYIGILIFVLIIISIFLILFFNSKNLPRPLRTEVLPSVSPTNNEVINKPSPQLTPNMYSNTNFQIKIPENFLMSEVDGAEPLTQFENKQTEQTIEIQIYDAQNTPLFELSKIFSSFEYASSSAMIGGFKAQEYVGSYIGDPPFQEIVYLFDNGGKVIKIQLTYRGQTRNFQIDNEFRQNAKTFKLLK